MTLQETNFQTMQAKEFAEDFLKRVRSPDERMYGFNEKGEKIVKFDEKCPFEDAVDFALLHPLCPFGEALLEVLRARWPKEVEKVLAKAAVA